jgi:SAM-dependent methyltransferase
MDPAEYAVMRAAEDGHWWYRGLREVVRLHWERHVTAPRPRLLDVGCGTGANLAALADRSEPVGIDFSPLAVAACRGRGLPATTVAASADRLPFGDAAFDVVLSCDVLGHRSLPDPLVPLREMARVLRPGGLVMLNLAAYRWLLSRHDEAYGQDKRYTRAEVRRLLAGAGFEVVACTHWNSLLFPAAAAARLWRRGGRGREGSDLAVASAASAGGALDAVLAVERRLLRLASLPVGLSVFAVGRAR